MSNGLNWEERKLSDISWFQEGPGLRHWQFTTSGIKVLNITNIVDGYLQLDKTSRYISLEEFNSTYKHFLIDDGDIVVASSGNSYCKLGIVRKCDLPLVLNTSVIRFKAINSSDTKFLYQFLKSSLFKDRIDFLITGSAQPNFGPSHLEKVFLQVPPVNEQKRIAEILTSVDRVIELTSIEIYKLKDLKKGMMQELLTKGIGHTKFKDSPVGDIPESWEVTKISDVSKLITKGTTPTTMGFEYLDKGVNFIKVECILENGVVESRFFSHISDEAHNSLKRSQLEEDDIVITIAGATVGKLAIIKKRYLPANTNQALAIIRLNKNKILHKYLFYFLQSGYITDEITKIATVGAQPNLSLAQIGNFIVALPNLEEQQKILNTIISIDTKIESLRRKDKSLESFKKGLMKDLLTGKVRVKV